jgi:hypothetical protein
VCAREDMSTWSGKTVCFETEHRESTSQANIYTIPSAPVHALILFHSGAHLNT